MGFLENVKKYWPGEQANRVYAGKESMNSNCANDSGQDAGARLIALWATLHDTIVGAVEDGLGERGLRNILYQPLFEAGREAAVGDPPDATGVAEEIMRLVGLPAHWEMTFPVASGVVFPLPAV